MIDKQVEITVGSSKAMISVTILEQIGNGFLARSEDGQFCSVHYNFSGQLHTAELIDSEDEARELAEASQGRMS